MVLLVSAEGGAVHRLKGRRDRRSRRRDGREIARDVGLPRASDQRCSTDTARTQAYRKSAEVARENLPCVRLMAKSSVRRHNHPRLRTKLTSMGAASTSEGKACNTCKMRWRLTCTWYGTIPLSASTASHVRPPLAPHSAVCQFVRSWTRRLITAACDG